MMPILISDYWLTGLMENPESLKLETHSDLIVRFKNPSTVGLGRFIFFKSLTETRSPSLLTTIT